MQRFARLMQDLDRDGSTTYKVDVLSDYFRTAPPRDAVWALYLLTGRKLTRLIKRNLIFSVIQKVAQIPQWLFDECYAVVGDLAETCTLLWPAPSQNFDPAPLMEEKPLSLHEWMESRIPLLSGMPPQEIETTLIGWWTPLSLHERWIAVKLITGGFRSGVAQGLVVKSLEKAFHHPTTYFTECLSGDWPVTEDWYTGLITNTETVTRPLSPLPFYLASPLESSPESLGSPAEFCIEWKWDGIRAQIIKRGDEVAIWSRGEELITDRFPELIESALTIDGDFVLDGEIVAMAETQVAPFALLQQRIGRKKVTTKLRSQIPVRFLAFDCLRKDQEDLRTQPLRMRRTLLEALLNANGSFAPSETLDCESWDEARELRKTAKKKGVEGLMLKRWDAPYRMGRKRGDLWKWKVDPMTLDAVLIYAQAGHGRRATLYTDYTFALWKDGQLVPFAKAYSGLDQSAIQELDQWIRKHTKERFGPVRSVEPLRVFEIAFEGLAPSPRHKSGIAVRFPRILRERNDKKPEEADTVETALKLIHIAGSLDQDGPM